MLINVSSQSGWLVSRLVSLLDSGAEGPRVQIAAVTMLGNNLRQTVHTHHASVHQAAKLVAALLRVVRVTAGLAESNGSLLLGLWLTSPAGWNRDQLWNPMLSNRIWATFTFFTNEVEDDEVQFLTQKLTHISPIKGPVQARLYWM